MAINRNSISALREPKDRHIQNFVLQDNVSHLLRRAHFRAIALFSDEFREEKLTARQKAVLISARQNPGATQNELARLVAIDRNAFAEILTRMIRKGYVVRKPSRDDGRAYRIYVSQKGLNLLLKVMPRDEMIEQKIIDPIPPEMRPLFIKCLKLMIGID